MLQITPHMRIFVAVEPTDFRKQIDSLAALCREKLGEDPFSGALFVFCSRRRHAVRVLVYDGQGYWLCTKRLSKGRFKAWPRDGAAGEQSRVIAAETLQVLLWNGDAFARRMAGPWRAISPMGLARTG